MKKTLLTLTASFSLLISSHAAVSFTGTDLISLGSNGIGALDGQSSTSFVQSSSAISFNATAALGDTFYNASNFGPVNWTSANGFYIRSTITTNPNLPFAVDFYDTNANVVASYTGTTNTFTTGTNQGDSLSYSYLNLTPSGSVSLSNISMLQFTFNGGATTNMVLHAISTTAPVPEPSTYALMAIGGLVVLFAARRRKAQV